MLHAGSVLRPISRQTADPLMSRLGLPGTPAPLFQPPILRPVVLSDTSVTFVFTFLDPLPRHICNAHIASDSRLSPAQRETDPIHARPTLVRISVGVSSCSHCPSPTVKCSTQPQVHRRTQSWTMGGNLFSLPPPASVPVGSTIATGCPPCQYTQMQRKKKQLSRSHCTESNDLVSGIWG